MSPPKSGYETTKGKERKAEKEENSGKLKRKVRKIEQRSEGERIDSRTCVFQQVSPSATASYIATVDCALMAGRQGADTS